MQTKKIKDKKQNASTLYKNLSLLLRIQKFCVSKTCIK